VVNASVYRTGGASDGTAYSWLCVTSAACGVGTEAATPWINVWVGALDEYYFDVFISHDSQGDGTGGFFTDTECWLEVEYCAAASTLTSIASDRATNILGAGADQDTDTSTWSDGDDQQRLRVTATIGKIGMVRARVVFAEPSVTCWVDPKVVVTAT
jgi:hypothetical protein